MTRKVFFSFDYASDVSRAKRLLVPTDLKVNAAAGFETADVWNEAEHAGESFARELIDNAIRATTVTVVLIGRATAANRYVDYAIERSIERGNGIIGVRIHCVADQSGKTDEEGPVPALLVENWYPVHAYTNSRDLCAWIEDAARTAGT